MIRPECNILGAAMSGTLIDDARDALRLAESDPGRAADLASDVLGRARQEGDHAAWSVAARALGLAASHNKDLDRAGAHLRIAKVQGRLAGSAALVAQARVTSAFVMSSRGWSSRALREIDAAIRDLTGSDRARGQAQRGVILHQMGRFDAALACYNATLPVLRRHADGAWLWRVLSNRGVLHGHRLELTKAAADLREAARLCDEQGLRMSAAYVLQNMGWVATLAGDVPTALSHLDEAEHRLLELGLRPGEVLRDRTEVLLSVHLVAEALETAAAAVRELEREGRLSVLPEARLLHANAALREGAHGIALDQARRAAAEFGRQARPTWRVLAQFTVLTARMAQGGPVPATRLVAIADQLEAAGWTATAVEARVAAGTLALRRGATVIAGEQLAAAARWRRRGSAAVRANAWYAAALSRTSTGNRRAAVAATRAGLRILDEHRAAFGATDLRARAAAHRVALTDLGLRLAFEAGRPERVLEWAERSRSTFMIARPVRPYDDRVLDGLLRQLRAAMAEVGDSLRPDDSRGDEKPAPVAVARVVALERQIRDHCRHHTQVAQLLEPLPARTLAERLGGIALVEYVERDADVWAVLMVDGRMSMSRLTPVSVVVDALERAAFAIRRLLRRRVTEPETAAAVGLLRDAGARLDAALLAPMAARIGDRRLVVVPTASLHSIPWSTLPSCAGRPVTVAPTAAFWHHATSGSRPAVRTVSVIAGPALPGARAEAERVARVHGVEPLVGDAATVAAASRALLAGDLVHLAAHGRIATENPLFSSLRLADGPLMIYDLERLPRMPATVVLAACDSARHVVWAGNELLGLASTILRQGARQLVASVIPVPDLETAPLMIALHRQLAAGASPAEALASAQRGVAAGGTGPTLAAAAAFICIGGD